MNKKLGFKGFNEEVELDELTFKIKNGVVHMSRKEYINSPSDSRGADENGAPTLNIFMNDDDGGQDFTADLVLSGTTTTRVGKIVLNGTDANSTDANDDVQLEDASGNIERESEKIASLVSPEKNTSLFKLPKKVIKTLLTATNDSASDTQITVRRQFVGTTTTGGVVSFTAGSNETFLAFAEKDYTMSVLTAGSGSASQGDIISVSGNIAGTGTATSKPLTVFKISAVR